MFSCIDTCIVSTALVNISTAMQDYLNASWAVLAYLLTYMSKFQLALVTLVFGLVAYVALFPVRLQLHRFC